MRALTIVLALGGCGVVGRDCSLPARLEAHAAERAEFRHALGPLVFRNSCPSTIPEVLIPEENRVDGYKRRLLERMSRSELGADVAEEERRAHEASRNASVAASASAGAVRRLCARAARSSSARSAS